MGQGSRSAGVVDRGTGAGRGPPRTREPGRSPGPGRRTRAARWRTWASPAHDRDISPRFRLSSSSPRSEERRVGKERRSRWAAYEDKIKPAKLDVSEDLE